MHRAADVSDPCGARVDATSNQRPPYRRRRLPFWLRPDGPLRIKGRCRGDDTSGGPGSRPVGNQGEHDRPGNNRGTDARIPRSRGRRIARRRYSVPQSALPGPTSMRTLCSCSPNTTTSTVRPFVWMAPSAWHPTDRIRTSERSGSCQVRLSLPGLGPHRKAVGRTVGIHRGGSRPDGDRGAPASPALPTPRLTT